MNLQQLEKLNNELMANLLEVCLNEKPCPLCSVMDMYTERVVVEIENNGEIKTEACECPCADGRRYLKHVQKQGLHGNYLRVRLPKMQPSRLCTLAPEKQKTLIAKVQKAPEEGWAFFGPPGTGKSMLTAALFKNALGVQWNKRQSSYHGFIRPYIFRITARQLCDEAQAQAMGKYDEGITVVGTNGQPKQVYSPTVTRAKIMAAKQQRLTPRLFLEEVDKVNLTDFRRDAIFDVVNAMHECKGQIVLNSNLSWEEFEQTFGTAFSWRINENCHVVDLYKNHIAPPKTQL